MLVDIDKSLEPKEYELILCKPNAEQLVVLDEAYNISYSPKFADIDELTFHIPLYVYQNHKKVRNSNFDLLQGDYLIFVNETQYFIIDDVKNEYTDDGIEYKVVHCFSREYELVNKKIRGYKADSRLLYDVANGTDSNGYKKGILNYIESITSWKIGYINAELLLKYRSFDISEQTILQTLLDIQRTYSCVFQYDTIDKIINVYKLEQLGSDKGLYISDENYIKSLTQNIKHGEIKTRLYLYGKDNISINSINSTGQSYIENFNFYKNTNFMSQGLIDKLNAYEILVQSKQSAFDGYLSQLDTLYATLSTKQTELSTLETELKIIEDNIDVAIENGNSLTALKQNETNKKAEISTKQAEIDVVKNDITTVNTNINTLRNEIKMENNFTQQELTELDYFVRYETYSDSNYTEENIQELYEEGKKLLSKISQPPIEFSIDVVDFLNVIECQHDWDKLILGDIVYIHHNDLGIDVQVRLIEYQHNIDDNSLSLKFSNRNAIDDPNTYLKDLLSSAVSSSSQVDFNKFQWSKYSEGERSEILTFINSSLDTAKNKVLAGKNQDIEVSDRGIWLRKKDANGDYLPEQMRLINNLLVMTTDNWNTAGTAIEAGKIYAEYLFGKILAGTNLVIENSSGTFRVDANGVTLDGMSLTIDNGLQEDALDTDLINKLNNAVQQGAFYNGVKIDTIDGLNVTRSDGLVRSIFNATEGISIEKKVGADWVKKFFADTNGNVNAHDLIAKNITIDGGLLKAGTDTLIDVASKKINFSKFFVDLGEELTPEKMNLKGLTINNGSKTTFSIDSDGNVFIDGKINMSADSVIQWENLSETAQSNIQPYTIIMSSDTVAIPTDADGNNPVLTTASTTITLFKGATTKIPTLGTLTTSGCTATKSGGTVTIASVSADVGYVDIPVYDGTYLVGTRRFTFAKAKQGTQGVQGETGASGSDANVPDWVTQWNSGTTTISSGYMMSPKIYAGTGGLKSQGVLFDVNGIQSYKNSVKNGFNLDIDGSVGIMIDGIQKGEFFYDLNTSVPTGSNPQRVFLKSYNGVALKLESGGDMSIGCTNSGDTLYIMGNVHFSGGTVEGLSSVAVFG